MSRRYFIGIIITIERLKVYLVVKNRMCYNRLKAKINLRFSMYLNGFRPESVSVQSSLCGNSLLTTK